MQRGLLALQDYLRYLKPEEKFTVLTSAVKASIEHDTIHPDFVEPVMEKAQAGKIDLEPLGRQSCESSLLIEIEKK